MGCSIPCHHRKIPSKPITSSLYFTPTNFVIENEHSFHNIYRLGKLLGTGSFGEVRSCVHRSTSTKRAVKIIRKDLFTSPKQREALDNEIKILKSLDHPCIIRVFEYFEEVKRLYIVMEHCKGGELFDEIVKQQKISEFHAACIMKQIFSVLEYLQKHEIVHRDLKPENILLEEKHDVMRIKIIDFGTAVFCDRVKRLTSNNGTLYYMAPEVIKGDYNFMCDMWSSGVILYILLAGYPPFDGKTNQDVAEAIVAGKVLMDKEPWQEISKEAKDLVKAILCPEEERISSTKALQTGWIVNNSSAEVEDQKVSKVLSSLQKFRANNFLKDAVKTYLTIQYLSAADVKDLREVFVLLDKNNDGKISYDELLEEYCKIVDRKEAERLVGKIIKEVDSDKSGFIDYSEFLRANVDYMKFVSEENLKNAFRMFDLDGSGKISAEELGRVLQGGNIEGKQLLGSIIEQFDANGDGEIDLEEFGMLVKAKSEMVT